MLTTTEARYINICQEQIASSATNEAIAERFGVARGVVDRAIRWGRERGLFALDTTEKLRTHLQELGATLHKLERAFLAMDRRYRQLLRRSRHLQESPPADPAAAPPALPGPRGNKDAGARGAIRLMALLAERILSFRTRIMELEGIYKHVLNIQHGGAITLRNEPDFTKINDDELNQLEALSQRIYGAN